MLRGGGAIGVTMVAVGVGLAACSLSSLDGLSGGADPASPDADGASPTEGGADAAVPTDAPSAGDAADAPAETSRPKVSLADCVLLLHMDEPLWTAPGKPVKDSSGSANDGAISGSAQTTANGKFGRAALLDGTGWIVVPHSMSLQGTNALTYAAWINLATLPATTDISFGIISKRRGYLDNVAFTLFVWTGNHAWADLTATRLEGSVALTTNTWYHLAVVYEGTAEAGKRLRLYTNGVLDKVTSAEAQLPANVEDLMVGNLPGGGNAFVGRIDEVAIWRRVLSDGEIASLAAATGPL